MNGRNFAHFEQELNHQNKGIKSKATLEIMGNLMNVEEKKIQRFSFLRDLCSSPSRWRIDCVDTASILTHFLFRVKAMV